jgi:hypothetical protein
MLRQKLLYQYYKIIGASRLREQGIRSCFANTPAIILMDVARKYDNGQHIIAFMLPNMFQ